MPTLARPLDDRRTAFGVPFGAGGLPGAVAAPVRRLARRLARKWRERFGPRATARRLSRLDGHLLRDIGLSRLDLEHLRAPPPRAG